MEKDFIDLFEFQTKLKEGVECLFPTRLWLRAELSAVKARPGGHCWLELSQSNDKGLVAKANAVIWSSKYRFLAPYFESVTGSPLREGMVILAEVQVNYSQLYGFSLIINDLDPEYSLGLKEIERQKTIERLVREGLMDLQKELSLPLLPYNLAVISAEDAAGYRDFIKHLEENPYGFNFNICLFPALMQGVDCPKSVIEALDAVLDASEDYDAVLILRGGGAKLDLACFDDYDLASVIAQYPLPVLTAIGHDQDYHVCDMVAHMNLKTPTALADEILSFYEDEDARLSSYVSRIKIATSSKISLSDSSLLLLRSRVKNAFVMKLTAMESALQLLKTRIYSADPRRIVERGYALVLDESGAQLRKLDGLKVGSGISLLYAEGRVDCTVRSVSLNGDK